MREKPNPGTPAGVRCSISLERGEERGERGAKQPGDSAGPTVRCQSTHRGYEGSRQEHCLRVSDKASRSDWPKIARETKLEEEAQIPSSSIHHPFAFVL